MKLTRSKVFSLLNLHFLGLGLLVILNLVLGVRLLLAWHTLHNAGPEQLAQAQSSYRALDLESRPLRGLPEKVDLARKQADEFYDKRFPGAYSAFISTIGDLSNKNTVRLTRVSYNQAQVIPGILEVRMDANLSGEYAALMHFINGLERSKTFFMISGLTLTGQQGGLVNLRLGLTTYIHSPDVTHITPPNQTAANGDTSDEEDKR